MPASDRLDVCRIFFLSWNAAVFLGAVGKKTVMGWTLPIAYSYSGWIFILRYYVGDNVLLNLMPLEKFLFYDIELLCCVLRWLIVMEM